MADSDGDEVGDNEDAFPNDPNESEDSDGDKVGDNSDRFPFDPNETHDSDNDGYGDNGDAFPANADKSVADVLTTQEATQPVVFFVCEKPIELQITATQTIETLNNGSIRTTLDKQYLDLNDQAIGWETSVVLQTNDQLLASMSLLMTSILMAKTPLLAES